MEFVWELPHSWEYLGPQREYESSYYYSDSSEFCHPSLVEVFIVILSCTAEQKSEWDKSANRITLQRGENLLSMMNHSKMSLRPREYYTFSSIREFHPVPSQTNSKGLFVREFVILCYRFSFQTLSNANNIITLNWTVLAPSLVQRLKVPSKTINVDVDQDKNLLLAKIWILY